MTKGNKPQCSRGSQKIKNFIKKINYFAKIVYNNYKARAKAHRLVA